MHLVRNKYRITTDRVDTDITDFTLETLLIKQNKNLMSNSVSLLPGVSHFIPLPQAIEMTTLYRGQYEAALVPELRNKQILPICETFNREAFEYLLNESGCVGIRLYFGMDVDLKVRIIAVAVNERNQDMLPAQSRGMSATNGEEIVEEGQRCPDDCPPPSPLNS